MSNQITLTFAGEPAPLSAAFSQVGNDAEQMADRSVESTRRMAEGLDYASSQSSMLSGGIGDVGGALTAAFGEESAIGAFGAEMERYGAIVMGVTGVTDLLLFATNNLKLGVLAKATADRVATAAQWMMNTAMLASPLTWIIVGIVALVAAVVLIATKTDWFSRAWRNSWKWVKDAASNSWDFIKKIPGWVGSAFKNIANFITAPYRAAFNGIARAWNATVGRLSWSVPSWVPFIGGNSISVPNLPTFHSGGIVPGVVGTAVPIMALAGERVSSIAGSSGGGGTVVVPDGPLIGMLVELLAAEVRGRGGAPDQLGIRLPRTS